MVLSKRETGQDRNIRFWWVRCQINLSNIQDIVVRRSAELQRILSRYCKLIGDQSLLVVAAKE
jgi:hypothetical protein